VTDKLAIALGLLIFVALLSDWLIFDWQVTVFMAKKLIELTEYMAFWR